MSNVMQYKGYHGKIEFSSEDNLFIGSVVGVNDSLNFHGSTVEELRQSFHDCIDDYLEMCEALGRSPDKEYKGSFNVRVGPELHRQAAIAAEKTGISLNQYVQDAIELKLEQATTAQSASVVPTMEDIERCIQRYITVPETVGKLVEKALYEYNRTFTTANSPPVFSRQSKFTATSQFKKRAQVS
ncbi:MAG: type II toxin-antitoxin system HicB family antitoxin [Clostridiales bacterium]|nr:type II toxin-antitoxin system HicB family antitoxin [Clostridiales bacterium]